MRRDHSVRNGAGACRPRRRPGRGVVALAGLLVLTGLAGTRLQAQSGAGAPSFTVGILPFQDVSGNPDLGQLSTVLPSLLQSELLDKTQLVPRQLNGAQSAQTDVATAAALGQQAGADVVALGTLLSGSVKTSQGSFNGPSFGPFKVQANRDKMSVIVLLQVDLIDVNRGTRIVTLRARGRDSVTHVDPNVDSNYGSMNMQSAGFQNTALARATKQALNRLAQEMVRALSRFTPAQPGAPAPTAVAPAPAAAAPAPAAAAPAPTRAAPASAAPAPPGAAAPAGGPAKPKQKGPGGI